MLPGELNEPRNGAGRPASLLSHVLPRGLMVALTCRREPNVDTDITQLLIKLVSETDLALVIVSSRDLGPVESELRPLPSRKYRAKRTPVRSAPSWGPRPLIGNQAPT